TDLENLIRAQSPPDYIIDEGFNYVIDRPYQSVQHHLFKVKAFSEMVGRSRINLTLSSQLNIRKEFDITRSASDLPQLQLNLQTHMADLVWEHFAGKKIKGSMGINAMYQDNFINYRYFVPNYQSVDLGLWLAERYQHEKWQVELGLRFDNRNRFNIKDNDKQPFDLLMGNMLVAGDPYGKRNFSGLSGTGVVAYKFNENLRTSFTASSAWRAPQVNELFSNGLHHGAARIERGDAKLNTERAYSILGTLIFNNEKWEAEFGVYNKEIIDFIYLKPAYPALLTIRGAFPAFDYAQTHASLSGMDVRLAYRVTNHFQTHVKASVLRAYDKTAKTWLIQMPSDRYEADLEYSFIDGKKLKQSSIKFGIQHVTKQIHVPLTGNIKVTDLAGITKMQSDYMLPPDAYTLFNLEAATGIDLPKRRIDFVFSITNLFDIAYRDYMNAFRYFALDRGRNISLKIKFPI
ncbi:MAG: TonB-dependent receptor domain-containing protein, partial [bacterium]